MSAFDLPKLARLDEDHIERFRRDGFLIIERFLSEDRVMALRERFPKLFAGKFDTGIYPDEWYWREGMSLPDVTRHMANAWKADLTVARLALSADVGRTAAQLAGWSGVRLGQDTIWWKAPKTKPIAHHQDSSFMDFLDPAETGTVNTVAALRAQAGRDPFDRELADLVGELSTRSEEFATLWATHNVRLHRKAEKRFHHPVVGDLTLRYERLAVAADPGLEIFAYMAEPGSRSEEAFRLLSSWAADGSGLPSHASTETPS